MGSLINSIVIFFVTLLLSISINIQSHKINNLQKDIVNLKNQIECIQGEKYGRL